MSAVVPFSSRFPAPHGDVVSFLVTDLEDGTRSRPGAAQASASAVHEALIRTAAGAQGGQVFKGDSHIFAIFAVAACAVAAALDLQRRFASLDFGAIGRFKIRAAIHAGKADPAGGARSGADLPGGTLARALRLMAIGYGDQVLISGATARMVGPGTLPEGATIERIGWFRLHDLRESELVYQLHHPDLPAVFPPLRSLNRTPNNLPVFDHACLDRHGELARLGAMLAGGALITVSGAPGVGKTRLVLQAAADACARYPDGVWFVELTPRTEAGQIAETICTLLTLKFGGDRTAADMLPRVLRHRRLLIVLDDCGHLRNEVAAIVADIVPHCRGVTIVATDTRPLGIDGEQSVVLPGLTLPDPAVWPTAAGALVAPAVRLFVARACQANPEFVLDDANAGTVAAICRRLGGVPLAIELAAARVRNLLSIDILRRLPEPGGADLLRGAIDGSYELLTPDEAVAFGRLAAFGGWFTVDAAGATIGLSPLRPIMVADLVVSLHGRALLVRSPADGGDPRYRLADTIRHYAVEKFDADAGRPEIMERLCDWLIRHYGDAERSWPTTHTDEWIARYRADLDNLRAALAWAFAPGGNPASGLLLMSLTSELWRDLGMTVEQRLWLRQAEVRIGPATPDRVAARIGLDIAFTYGGGAFGDKRHVDLALDALVRYRHVGSAEEIATAAGRIAVCVANPEDTTAAQPYVDLIEVALPTIGRTRRRAWLLNILAALVHFGGDVKRAIGLLEEVVSISRDYGDDVNTQMAGLNLAEILFASGETERAALEAGAVAMSCRETGNLLDLGFALGNIAAYALIRGETAVARATLIEAIPLVADINIEFVLGSCLQSVALLAAQEGDFNTAARMAGFTAQFYERIAIAREATEQAVHTALVAALDRQAAADPGFAERRVRLMAQGADWQTRIAVGEAETLLLG